MKKLIRFTSITLAAIYLDAQFDLLVSLGRIKEDSKYFLVRFDNKEHGHWEFTLIDQKTKTEVIDTFHTACKYENCGEDELEQITELVFSGRDKTN